MSGTFLTNFLLICSKNAYKDILENYHGLNFVENLTDKNLAHNLKEKN